MPSDLYVFCAKRDNIVKNQFKVKESCPKEPHLRLAIPVVSVQPHPPGAGLSCLLFDAFVQSPEVTAPAVTLIDIHALDPP